MTSRSNDERVRANGNGDAAWCPTAWGVLKNPVPNQGATDKRILRLFARRGGCLSVSFSHNPKKDTDKEDRAKKPLSLPCPWHPCNQAVVLIDRGFSTSPLPWDT
jgi:hypothetical protein